MGCKVDKKGGKPLSHFPNSGNLKWEFKVDKKVWKPLPFLEMSSKGIKVYKKVRKPLPFLEKSSKGSRHIKKSGNPTHSTKCSSNELQGI